MYKRVYCVEVENSMSHMLCATQLCPCTYSSHHSAVSTVMFVEAVALFALILLIFAITSGKDRSKNGLPLPPGKHKSVHSC